MCGRLILDTTCFGAIVDTNVRDRFRRSLRAVDLTPWPSAVNALQIAAHDNQFAKARLKAALFALLDDRFLLPWPYDLLRDSRNFAGGDAKTMWIERSGVEEILLQPERLKTVWDQLKLVLRDTDDSFNKQIESFRPAMQRLLKRKGLRDPWTGLGEFLDSQWADSDLRAHIIGIMWERLGLPAPAPVGDLLRDEMWRLLLDIEGAAVFERAVVHEVRRRADRTDLLQLLYLAYAPRRIIATADHSMLRAAQGILHRRYPNALATSMEAILAAA